MGLLPKSGIEISRAEIEGSSPHLVGGVGGGAKGGGFALNRLGNSPRFLAPTINQVHIEG